MGDERAVTITNIHSVLKIKKDYPAGTVADYSAKSGCPTHELVFRLYGAVETSFDGVVLQNEKDTVEFLPKFGGQRYSVKTLQPGACIDVLFDSDAPLFAQARCLRGSAELGALFAQLHKVWLKKERNYYHKAMSLLYRILSELCLGAAAEAGSSPRSRKIAPGLDYLDEHFCEPDICFEEVAALCSMSYSYFRRLFKECVGVPPVNYVLHKKIEYAGELLTSRQYRVGEVAQLVGMSDVYYFSRKFRELTGKTPSQHARSRP